MTNAVKRLGIVVPYRDRQEHLAQFLPHIHAYFARDKLDRDIPVHVIIVKQPPGLPFNRGMMRNIGFEILKDRIDYVCFHDVDYLPIWADYSFTPVPAMIIWHGLEAGLFSRLQANPDTYFAGVMLLSKEHFQKANGFSNDYWGWGHEDLDLKLRLESVGLKPTHRRGTFASLAHESERSVIDAAGTVVRSPANQRNRDLCYSRWNVPGEIWKTEGLNSLKFNVLERAPIGPPVKERDIPTEGVLVQFEHRP